MALVAVPTAAAITNRIAATIVITATTVTLAVVPFAQLVVSMQTVILIAL